MIPQHLKQRLVSTALIAPLFLLVIYFSDIPLVRSLFGVIITAVAILSLWEFYRLAQAKGKDPTMAVGIVGSMAYLYTTYLNALIPGMEVLPFFTLGVTFLVGFIYFFISGDNPLINLSITFFGILYLTIPLGTMISINFVHALGKWWLIYLIFVTKMTDTGGYFIGKQWGKFLLAPYISPKKTWEGAIGGLLLGCATSIAFYFLFQELGIRFTFAESIYLGLALSVLAQVGDLSESLLKRDAGVKDSNQLPGLGGMLDILDALVFASPFLYFFLIMH